VVLNLTELIVFCALTVPSPRSMNSAICVPPAISRAKANVTVPLAVRPMKPLKIEQNVFPVQWEPTLREMVLVVLVLQEVYQLVD